MSAAWERAGALGALARDEWPYISRLYEPLGGEEGMTR